MSADSDEESSNENNGTKVSGWEGAKEANQADQADQSNDVTAKSRSPVASVKAEPIHSSDESVANFKQDREFTKAKTSSPRNRSVSIPQQNPTSGSYTPQPLDNKMNVPSTRAALSNGPVANPGQEQTIGFNVQIPNGHSQTPRMPHHAQQSRNYANPPPNAQRRNSNFQLFGEHSHNVPSGPRFQTIGSQSSRNSSLTTDTPRENALRMPGNISHAKYPHMDMPTAAHDNEAVKSTHSKSSSKAMNFSADQEISESNVPLHGVVMRQPNAYPHCGQCSTPYGAERGRNYVIDMGLELPLQDCEIRMRRFRNGAKTAYIVLWPHIKDNLSTDALTEVAYVAKFLKWFKGHFLLASGNIRSAYLEFASTYPRPHRTEQKNATLKDEALANFQAKTQSASKKHHSSRKRGREDMGDDSSGHVKRQYH
ncbi:hypothetical protein BTUL_0136g00180 [Botrytis tulipae]|uniref:Uncharacterized protein n=1 Tax=Botrytis tulipae TaxID=87230 RepID=A0A4Z1EDN8_9HELO|nr:hypothetical protein BTUL_0136g00180 [Botrytis tulipae]